MITPYTTAIASFLGSIPVLLGVLITARSQTANQKNNNQAQAKLAQDKARNDAREATATQLAIAHKILSQIAREFSLTGLNIMQTASMPVAEFNSKYFSLCEKAEELLMIVDFHAPAASEAAHELYGQMSMFWGHFKAILHQAEKGETAGELNYSLNQTHEAARKITDKARIAKYQLSDAFKSQLPGQA